VRRLAILTTFVAGTLALTASPATPSRHTAAAAKPMTMQLGRGLGLYRIGMRRAVHANLVRAIRQPENDGPGCSGGFAQDAYVDVYPGLRLGYGPGLDRKGYLDTIATTRRGDRTSLGYAIGTATLADVRKRYPKVRLSRHRGGSELSLYRLTGEESAASLVYGFNASGTLVRLQTGVGGC
jgi:hypothetical protein